MSSGIIRLEQDQEKVGKYWPWSGRDLMFENHRMHGKRVVEEAEENAKGRKKGGKESGGIGRGFMIGGVGCVFKLPRKLTVSRMFLSVGKCAFIRSRVLRRGWLHELNAFCKK